MTPISTGVTSCPIFTLLDQSPPIRFKYPQKESGVKDSTIPVPVASTGVEVNISGLPFLSASSSSSTRKPASRGLVDNQGGVGLCGIPGKPPVKAINHRAVEFSPQRSFLRSFVEKIEVNDVEVKMYYTVPVSLIVLRLSEWEARGHIPTGLVSWGVQEGLRGGEVD